MQLTMFALAAILALTGPQPESPSKDPGVIEECTTTIIDEADVPAEVDGKLLELKVIEGQQVTKGEVLGRIDDRMATRQKEVAEYKLEAAEAEAGNDVNVRYAKATNAVAITEHTQMVEANRTQSKTFPAIEVRRALLKIEETKLQIEQADHEQRLAGLKANIQRGELEVVKLDLERHQIVSPLNGEVVKRHILEGEWVKPGDPVMHVVRLDRLRVKGALDSTQIAPSEVAGKPVTVEVVLAHDRRLEFPGKIVHIDPQYAGRSAFVVWAEVYNRQENGRWLLGYDMTARMTIHWRQKP